jgi:hypothetical protein
MMTRPAAGYCQDAGDAGLETYLLGRNASASIVGN